MCFRVYNLGLRAQGLASRVVGRGGWHQDQQFHEMILAVQVGPIIRVAYGFRPRSRVKKASKFIQPKNPFVRGLEMVCLPWHFQQLSRVLSVKVAACPFGHQVPQMTDSTALFLVLMDQAFSRIWPFSISTWQKLCRTHSLNLLTPPEDGPRLHETPFFKSADPETAVLSLC